MSNENRVEKFTPGPWFSDGLYIITYDEFYLAETIGGFSDGIEVANANLIAAAPELYEALKEVVSISDHKDDAWDRAKAALAKARGETVT